MSYQNRRQWLGPQTACDICNTPFSKIDWFADAATVINGRRTWAIVCPVCHGRYTKGTFGLGIGQKYDAKTKIKLEG